MREYHKDENYKKAEELLEKILNNEISELEINEKLKICDDYGYFKSSIDLLKQALKNKNLDNEKKDDLKKQLIKRLQGLSSDEFQDMNYNEAMNLSSEGLKYDKTNLEFRRIICDCYFELCNYSDALECYREYLQTDPKNPEVLRNIGICYLEHGQYNKAKSYLEKAINLDPNDSLTLAKLGSISLSLDNYQKAIHYYESSLGNSFNKFPVEWRNLGYVYLSWARSKISHDKYEKIIDLLEKAKKLYDKAFEIEKRWSISSESNFDVWFEYGELNFYLGKRKTAKKAFLKAKSIDSKLWEYFGGEDFFKLMKEDEKIVSELISKYKRSKKLKNRYIYYCPKCKKSYTQSDSFQKTLDGKFLCPKHKIPLKKYANIRYQPK